MADKLRRKGRGLSWYKDELLELAKDLGYRLLPAFNTSTGIPYPRVNLLLKLFWADKVCSMLLCITSLWCMKSITWLDLIYRRWLWFYSTGEFNTRSETGNGKDWPWERHVYCLCRNHAAWICRFVQAHSRTHIWGEFHFLKPNWQSWKVLPFKNIAKVPYKKVLKMPNLMIIVSILLVMMVVVQFSHSVCMLCIWCLYLFLGQGS